MYTGRIAETRATFHGGLEPAMEGGWERGTEAADAHGEHGIIVAFLKIDETAVRRQHALAAVLRSPIFHADACLGVRRRGLTASGETWRYTMDTPQHRWTSLIGKGGGLMPSSDDFLRDESKYEAFWVPVKNKGDLAMAHLWGYSQQGIKYGYGQAVSALVVPPKRIWRPAALPSPRPRAKFCSQFVVALLQAAGALGGHFLGFNARFMNPADLYKEMLKLESEKAGVTRIRLSEIVMFAGEQAGE